MFLSKYVCVCVCVQMQTTLVTMMVENEISLLVSYSILFGL